MTTILVSNKEEQCKFCIFIWSTPWRKSMNPVIPYRVRHIAYSHLHALCFRKQWILHMSPARNLHSLFIPIRDLEQTMNHLSNRGFMIDRYRKHTALDSYKESKKVSKKRGWGTAKTDWNPGRAWICTQNKEGIGYSTSTKTTAIARFRDIPFYPYSLHFDDGF